MGRNKQESLILFILFDLKIRTIAAVLNPTNTVLD